MASMASSGGLTDLILMRVRIDEGGCGHKMGINPSNYILFTYTGENFGLITNLTKVMNYGKDRLN